MNMAITEDVFGVMKAKRGIEMKFEVDEFKNKLLEFFEENQQTNWGKIQLRDKIKDIYIKYLESKLNEHD